MYELRDHELDLVGGAEDFDLSAAGEGLALIGGAVASAGGLLALVPGGQIPGAVIAANGALLTGFGGGLVLADGFF